MNKFHPRSPWTPERIERLRHLWDDLGWSAVAISRDLGLSKGSVIGKSRRIGCQRRASPIKDRTLPVLTPEDAERRGKPPPRPKVPPAGSRARTQRDKQKPPPVDMPGPRIDCGRQRHAARARAEAPITAPGYPVVLSLAPIPAPPLADRVGCQWLEGDGPFSDADKCGAPRLRREDRPPSSYCAEHHLRCHRPAGAAA